MIEATYGEIRRASIALRALTDVSLGVDNDGKPAAMALSLKTVLKIKRIAGVVDALTRQAEEQQVALYKAAGLGDGDALTPPVIEKVNELYAVECQVGSEVLRADDFAALEDAQVGLARVLLELGPWFVDEGAEAAPERAAPVREGK